MPQAISTNFLYKDLIAPCGMNCALCIAHQRAKNHCAGCLSDTFKATYCQRCYIKNCVKLQDTHLSFCFECDTYPCKRFKNLDKRYRSKYGMSMLKNLEFIQEFGIEKFIEKEKGLWTCVKCGHMLSVHRDSCIYCKAQNKRYGIPISYE